MTPRQFSTIAEELADLADRVEQGDPEATKDAAEMLRGFAAFLASHARPALHLIDKESA